LFFFMSYGRFLLHSDEGSFVLFFCEWMAFFAMHNRHSDGNYG
jgi:hypothetical protein